MCLHLKTPNPISTRPHKVVKVPYPTTVSIIFSRSLRRIKIALTLNMGQRSSKQIYQEPMYSGQYAAHNQYYSGGHGNHEQYAQKQYRREDYVRKEQMKKRSRMNGIVAAVAGAA